MPKDGGKDEQLQPTRGPGHGSPRIPHRINTGLWVAEEALQGSQLYSSEEFVVCGTIAVKFGVGADDKFDSGLED